MHRGTSGPTRGWRGEQRWTDCGGPALNERAFHVRGRRSNDYRRRPNRHEMPRPSRNDPPPLWRPRFPRHSGRRSWAWTKESPRRLGLPLEAIFRCVQSATTSFVATWALQQRLPTMSADVRQPPVAQPFHRGLSCPSLCSAPSSPVTSGREDRGVTQLSATRRRASRKSISSGTIGR